MKKAFALILTLLILVNYTFTSVSYADTHYTTNTVDYGNTETLEELNKGVSGDNLDDLLQNGAASVTEQTDSNGATNQKNQKIGFGATILNGLLKILISVFIAIPKAASWILSMVVGTSTFTIGELLSNDYDLFGIKFWEIHTTGDNSNIINAIRQNVAIWYYSIRTIAVIGMVAILIYLGIRLAITLISSDASSAKERAKYKSLFINWLQGIALMFILHLIIIAVIWIVDIFLNVIVDITTTIQTNMGSQAIEAKLVEETWSSLWAKDNEHPFWTFIIYTMLIYYEIKFFLAYLFRTVRIYFYVVISPLVCMTYSLDKAGDGKSQAFDNWVREILGDIFIQPIQLIVYTIFILSASALISKAPILMVILLASISNIEKIITKIILGGKPQFSKGPKDFKITKPGEWMKV